MSGSNYNQEILSAMDSAVDPRTLPNWQGSAEDMQRLAAWAAQNPQATNQSTISDPDYLRQQQQQAPVSQSPMGEEMIMKLVNALGPR